MKGLGGETFTFNGFTVEAVQGHHKLVPDEYMRKDRAAAAAVGGLEGGLTPEQQAHDRLGGMVPLDAEERENVLHRQRRPDDGGRKENHAAQDEHRPR